MKTNKLILPQFLRISSWMDKNNTKTITLKILHMYNELYQYLFEEKFPNLTHLFLRTGIFTYTVLPKTE